MFQRVGMGQQVARFVVGIAVITAFRIAFTDQAVAVVIVEMQDGAVGADDGLYLPLVAVLIAGNAPHRIGMAEQPAQTVALHQYGAAVGKHLFGQLVVVVVMILLGTAQHVGYLGITVVIGKAPFLAQGGPVAQHLAGRGVMVVFVFRYQSGRIRVRHHQIVFIAEAAFDLAVAADDADQVAAAVVFVADQRTADPDRLAEDRQTFQQRHRQQPHFGRLLIRHIAEVQREHPAVAVDDVLRQAGQRMIDETLMVAVGVFHRHQREEGGIFVRTVFRHHQRCKTQRYRTVQRSNDVMAVRIFAEPNLFALEQDRFLIVFIDFRQREQTALIVDIGQSRRVADDALAAGYAPALAEPAGTVLVGIIAAAPDQRQDAFKGKVGFPLQKLQPVYRIDRAAGSGSGFAGNTGFGRQFFLELVVHVEHIAGAYDVALADFNRRGVHHRPGGFGGGARQHPLAARKGGFVTGGAVGFTGLEDEGGLAVEADVFGDGLSTAQVGEEGEGDGRCDRRSRRGRPAEIGEGTDYIEVAVFTGDFVEGHGGLLLLGMGSSERQNPCACVPHTPYVGIGGFIWGTACCLVTIKTISVFIHNLLFFVLKTKIFLPK